MSKIVTNVLQALFNQPFQVLEKVQGTLLSAKANDYHTTRDSNEYVLAGKWLKFVRWDGSRTAIFQLLGDDLNPKPIVRGHYNTKYRYFAVDMARKQGGGDFYLGVDRHNFNSNWLNELLNNPKAKTWFFDGKLPELPDTTDPLGLKKLGDVMVIVHAGNAIKTVLQTVDFKEPAELYNTVKGMLGKVPSSLIITVVDAAGVVGKSVTLLKTTETVQREVVRFQ